MTDPIVIPITATGGSSAAAELEKPARAMDGLTKATERATQAQLTKEQATQKLSAGLGALGGALGQIDPMLGGFGASIGRAGGAIGAMTALVGGGPGIAFGGAVAILGMLGSAFRSTGDAAADATTKIEGFISALDTQIRKTAEASQAQQRVRALLAGGGTPEERAAAADITRGEIAALDRPGMFSTAGERFVYEQKLKALQERERMLSAPVYGAGEEITIETGAVLRPGDPGWDEALRATGRAPARRGGARRGPATPRALTRGESAIMAMGGGPSGYGRDFGIFGQLDMESAAGGVGGQRDLDAFLGEASERDGKFGAVGGERHQQYVDEMVAQAAQVKDAWQDAGSSMVDSIGGVFAAMATGGAEATQAMLAQLGDQMVASGFQKLAQGAFSTLMGNPLGPTAAAIGAAEIGFGTVLGATVSAPSVGGMGGGGRPSPGMSGGGPANDNGPTVINMYSLSPTAESGRAIAKGLREQRRKGGW